jgi:hypothetical protein
LSIAKQRVQEKVLAIAATGVLKFQAEELSPFHQAEDARKPEYEALVHKLQDIKDQNDQIAYVYIMRPTGIPEQYAFVADSNSTDPFTEKDRNGDGLMNQDDEAVFPGHLYDNTGSIPPTSDAFLRPTAFEPYTDPWGTFISGWAPIKDAYGTSVAVLGVDMNVEIVPLLSAQTFALFSVFVGALILAFFLRPSKLRDSLFKELLELLYNKKFLLFVSLYIFSACVVVAGMSWHTKSLHLEKAKELLQSIAVTGALQIDGNDLAQLQVQDDWKKPEWAKVVHILENIRRGNPNILYVYILRKNPQNPMKIDFVSDSHSLNPFANSDDDLTNDIEVMNEGRDPGVSRS